MIIKKWSRIILSIGTVTLFFTAHQYLVKHISANNLIEKLNDSLNHSNTLDTLVTSRTAQSQIKVTVENLSISEKFEKEKYTIANCTVTLKIKKGSTTSIDTVNQDFHIDTKNKNILNMNSFKNNVLNTLLQKDIITYAAAIEPFKESSLVTFNSNKDIKIFYPEQFTTTSTTNEDIEIISFIPDTDKENYIKIALSYETKDLSNNHSNDYLNKGYIEFESSTISNPLFKTNLKQKFSDNKTKIEEVFIGSKKIKNEFINIKVTVNMTVDDYFKYKNDIYNILNSLV